MTLIDQYIHHRHRSRLLCYACRCPDDPSLGASTLFHWQMHVRLRIKSSTSLMCNPRGYRLIRGRIVDFPKGVGSLVQVVWQRGESRTAGFWICGAVWILSVQCRIRKGTGSQVLVSWNNEARGNSGLYWVKEAAVTAVPNCPERACSALTPTVFLGMCLGCVFL